MSKPGQPQPVKLIVGLLAAGEAVLAEALGRLDKDFGPVEETSPGFPFDQTAYYEPEMGPGLIRAWAGFREPVDPGRLAGLKLAANALEQDLARPDGRRRVNLDPGLLSLGSLVLATGKPAQHRIYLAQGIWAEVTLLYCRGVFEPFSWTYPDYRDDRLHRFLHRCRRAYLAQIKEAE